MTLRKIFSSAPKLALSVLLAHLCLHDDGGGVGVEAFEPEEPIVVDPGQAPSPPQYHHQYQDAIKPQIAVKIAGGELADEGDYPWYISPISTTFCGASLIHEDVAMTAAHCDAAFASRAEVYVGSVVRGTTVGGALLRRVSTNLPHPQYDSDTLVYDVMLLKLNQAVPADQVQPLAYNTDSNLPADDTQVVVMGYGSTGQGETPTFNLRDANLFATDNARCNQVNGQLFEEQVMMCAGDPDNPTSACRGDSGGPLVMQQSDVDGGGMVQVGIVSFGLSKIGNQVINSCGNPEVPTVYTRVSAVSNWILAGICAMSDNPPANCNEAIPPDDPIVIPSPAPTPQTPPPTETPLTVTVSFMIQYDLFPQEVDFFILTYPEGRQLSSRPDADANPYSRIRYRYNTVPLGQYEFVMIDDAKDGLSRGFVKGFVEVYQHLEEDDTPVLIAYGSHDFGYTLNIPFNVTEEPMEIVRPTQTPTGSPTRTPTRAMPTAIPTTALPTMTPIPTAQPNNNPPFVIIDDGKVDGVGDDNLDDEDSDLLGLGLSDTVSYAILGVAALVLLGVLMLLIRCLCCSSKPIRNQRGVLP